MAFRTTVNLNRGGVGISEYTVESWLHERPDLIQGEGLDPVVEWIGWQYRLPTGIADLVGRQANGDITLIEVKRLHANKSDIWQLLRYEAGIQTILDGSRKYQVPKVHLVLVADRIGWKNLEEARAHHIKVFRYDAIGDGGVYTGLTLQALWPEGILHHG